MKRDLTITWSVITLYYENREMLMKKWLRRIRGAVAMGLAWAAGWTLVGMLGVLPFALGTPSTRFQLWLLGVTIVGSTTLLSVVSVIGSALLFRYVARQRIPWFL